MHSPGAEFIVLGVPLTGKSVGGHGIEMFRAEGGQIVEFWRKDGDVCRLM